MADIDSIDYLLIQWPNGLEQKITEIPVNVTIRVTEGRARWAHVYQKDAPKAAETFPARVVPFQVAVK